MEKHPFRLAWATDLHLPDYGEDAGDKLMEYIDLLRDENPHAILLTGDIADSFSICRYLEMFAQAFAGINIYFVLGNHDFYGAYFEEVRQRVGYISGKYKNLFYLHTSQQAFQLTPLFGLVGIDGWGDGMLGFGDKSNVRMNDWKRIFNFSNYGTDTQKWEYVKEVGKEHAQLLGVQLSYATGCFKNVVVATHVPPWESVCEFEGQVTDPDQMPHYTCAAVGNVIDSYLHELKDKCMVCCGHTHSAVSRLLKPRLHVQVGGMETKRVKIQDTMLLPWE